MALQTMFSAKPNSPQTTLTAQISADATSLTVFDGSVLPSAPNLLTLGTDENAEVVYYTTLSGNTVSGLVRGYSGTTASVWAEGIQVSREYTSYDHDAFINNINALQNDVAALDTEVDGKQDTLTFDSTPTASSTNPVTSGGIKTALDGKATLYTNISQLGFSDKTTVVNLVTAMPDNSILVTQGDNALTTSELPDSHITWGMLEIIKHNNVRWDAKWYSQLASADQYYEYGTSGAYDNGVLVRTSWKCLHPDILYFTGQATSATSSSAVFCTVSDNRITAKHVVTEIYYSNSSAVTSNVSWSTTAGQLTLSGINTNANNTVTVTLALADNL